jgi:ArsR family transcriptional regulator, arsenate/arsenite/antimonite-responsive transcriptional repressor
MIWRLKYIPVKEYSFGMNLVKIYECLCDRTRLRILNLLLRGPLCVCHFQVVLGEPQVKISKHLNYLRRRGLVTARREGNWMIYALPEKASRELRANLACLQDCAGEQPLFNRDLARRAQRAKKFSATSPCCCVPTKERQLTAG